MDPIVFVDLISDVNLSFVCSTSNLLTGYRFYFFDWFFKMNPIDFKSFDFNWLYVSAVCYDLEVLLKPSYIFYVAKEAQWRGSHKRISTHDPTRKCTSRWNTR